MSWGWLICAGFGLLVVSASVVAAFASPVFEL